MAMREVIRLLRDFGRGVVGALLLGTPFLFTMETWWIGWRIPAWYLLAYSVAGLLLILLLVRAVGWREEEKGRRPPLVRLVTSFSELLLQSFLASYVILLAFGIVEVDQPLIDIIRLGLMQMVPLGLGAAIANRVLPTSDEPEEAGGRGEGSLTSELALFALGALFFIVPIAPTEEMDLLAAHAGWWRMGLIALLSILLTYLALYELAFRGRQGRLAGLRPLERWGETFLAYAVAFFTAFAALAAFGHLADAPFAVWVQKTIVLAFPAALGGSAARVVV